MHIATCVFPSLTWQLTCSSSHDRFLWVLHVCNYIYVHIYLYLHIGTCIYMYILINILGIGFWFCCPFRDLPSITQCDALEEGWANYGLWTSSNLILVQPLTKNAVYIYKRLENNQKNNIDNTWNYMKFKYQCHEVWLNQSHVH